MRAYLRTFGCRANQYDTEAVRAMIEAAGGVIVDTPDDADVALFNSCAVTAAAEADLRQERPPRFEDQHEYSGRSYSAARRRGTTEKSPRSPV